MKKDYWLLVLAVLNALAVVLLISRLPDIVPTHFGISGEVDDWGSKWTLLVMGALAPVTWVGMTLLPSIDPKKDNYRKFAGSYRIIRAVLVIVMCLMVWPLVFRAMEMNVNVSLLVKLLIGVLFVILGNVMTRLRPNWFTGIKTAWTLADPVVWTKTHRLAGFLMTAGGLLFLVSAALGDRPAGFWIPLIITVGGALFSVVYSAYLWKKRHPGENVSEYQRQNQSENGSNEES